MSAPFKGMGLQNAHCEIISGMSALNMPTPEQCPPDMVAHSMDHFREASRKVGEASSRVRQAESVLCHALCFSHKGEGIDRQRVKDAFLLLREALGESTDDWMDL